VHLFSSRMFLFSVYVFHKKKKLGEKMQILRVFLADISVHYALIKYAYI
jgi:hypothetical protein